MSLGVVIKGPEGIVLAADSRITLEASGPGGLRLPVNFDNATKLLTFSTRYKYVGAVTYGAAVIGLRTAHSYLPEFDQFLAEQNPKGDHLSILNFSRLLSRFFQTLWQAVAQSQAGPPMTFIVGGYDDGAAYGSVYLFAIPAQPEPEPKNPGEGEFGMTWGGQLEFASRIVQGYDPALPAVLSQTLNLSPEQVDIVIREMHNRTAFRVPYAVLPLQDCVDLATFLIRVTATAQALSIGVRGVGGPIDVATITRTQGLKYVQQKEIHGELGSVRKGGPADVPL